MGIKVRNTTKNASPAVKRIANRGEWKPTPQ
jgi:hypothetical protein